MNDLVSFWLVVPVITLVVLDWVCCVLFLYSLLHFIQEGITVSDVNSRFNTCSP